MIVRVPDETTALVTLEREDDGISAALRETDDFAPLTREQITSALRALADELDDENGRAGD